MKHTLTAISVALVLPAVLFSLQHWSEETLESLEQVIPGPFSHANFREVAAGEFTGDLELDAVLMDGGLLELAPAPEVFRARVTTGTIPSAFAVLPGAVPGKDLLLVADEFGLRSLEWDTETWQWISTTIFDEESAWVSAVELEVGDLDGADGLDVVAIDAAGSHALVAYGAGDGTFVEGTPVTFVGPPAYVLRLLNWRETNDVAGTDEIAAGSAIGIAVFETDGTMLDYLQMNSPNMKLTTIRDTGTLVERVVFSGKLSNVDLLRIYGDTQTTTWFPIGAAGVVALASGDADQDGDSDLFISVNTEKKFWMLENQSPATPTFVAANVQKFAFGPSDRNPAWNLSGLAIADFDSDGANDVLAPAQGGNISQGGGLVHVHGTLPIVHVGTANPAAWRVGVEDVLYNVETDTLHVLLTEPDELLVSQGNAETKLQVSVWRTPALGQPTIALAYHSSLIDMPNPVVSFSLEIPGFSPETSPDVFSFVVRQVSVESGEIVDQATALSALFVSAVNSDLVGSASETEVWIPSSIYPDSNDASGGLGMGPTLPPTPPGDVPHR